MGNGYLLVALQCHPKGSTVFSTKSANKCKTSATSPCLSCVLELSTGRLAGGPSRSLAQICNKVPQKGTLIRRADCEKNRRPHFSCQTAVTIMLFFLDSGSYALINPFTNFAHLWCPTLPLSTDSYEICPTSRSRAQAPRSKGAFWLQGTKL